MSTRWFFPWARVGGATAAPGKPLQPEVTFRQTVNGQVNPVTAAGPALTPVGPGDVLGFDRGLVAREEPPPGTTTAAENILAGVELTHADLPWLLSPGEAATPSGPVPLPWLVLIVLEESEAAPPRDANPLPLLTVPAAAQPPLAESWAWAHVEARLDDSVRDRATAAKAAADGVRARSAGVVARLLCPRRLIPDRGWIAAVVPATAAGVAVGRSAAPAGPPLAPAWTGAGPVELPVYHWWTFRTGQAGTFEDLARRLRFRPAGESGLGTRTIDVSRPWPAEDPAGPATVAVEGALRAPGPPGPESWSDPVAQDRFRSLIRERLDLPAVRGDREHGHPMPDRDAEAVGPPLYGSHHSGVQTVPAGESWLTTLNLEVRRRVAAALGARYVQLEQEFLMARAWEQVGEIRAANRLLAATELAAAAAEASQRKHFRPLDPADLLTTVAPLRHRLTTTMAPVAGQGLVAGGAAGPVTLATALAASPVTAGAASTAFARLTRKGGAVARRAGRLDTGAGPEPTVVLQGLTAMGAMDGGNGIPGGMPGELTDGLSPVRLHLRRIADRIPHPELAVRDEDMPRPLGPIMAHPHFTVPIAEELLSRWPEWAIPGIGGLPPDSVTLLETNPEFIAALLVGLNQEFNRELLWREFPTDQRGTAFARFWPTDGDDVDEIARWPVEGVLGSQVRSGTEGNLALLVRGELLRRFPATALLAVRGEGGNLPAAFAGIPATPLPLEEGTILYLFPNLGETQARAEGWFFVFREPMRGTQFGFDLGGDGALRTWADLTWDAVRVGAGQFVSVASVPPTPNALPPDDPAVWGRDPADMARIAFQQPFQLAFAAAVLLGA
jgi:hypothetical protein